MVKRRRLQVWCGTRRWRFLDPTRRPLSGCRSRNKKAWTWLAQCSHPQVTMLQMECHGERRRCIRARQPSSSVLCLSVRGAGDAAALTAATLLMLRWCDAEYVLWSHAPPEATLRRTAPHQTTPHRTTLRRTAPHVHLTPATPHVQHDINSHVNQHVQ